MNLWDRAVDFMGRRKTDYMFTFRSPAGARVLADLAKFCRAHETTFNTDARLSDALTGRRDVWLRIQNHLNLTSEELANLARPQVNGYPLKPTTGD